MSVDHAFLVLLAKSFGLICFVVASVLVLVYALRPSARERFERAGRSIVDGAEDRPAPRDAPSGQDANPSVPPASSAVDAASLRPRADPDAPPGASAEDSPPRSNVPAGGRHG